MGGTGVWASGENIVTSYSGQNQSYANTFMHYWDDGLFVSEFGQGNNTDQFMTQALPGASGNNLSSIMVPAPNGDLYVFNTDEFEHAGLHVWQISGLDTIHEISASGTLGGSTISLADSTGPVANWHDDQVNGTSLPDSTPNANNGTLNGSGVFFSHDTNFFDINTPNGTTPGGDSLAFTSNNSAGYVSVPNTANLNFSGGISISAWVKAAADTGTQDILTHGSIAGGTEVYLRINAGNYEVGALTAVASHHGVSIAKPCRHRMPGISCS